MRLYYEGTDISDDVDIIRCVHKDVSGGRCDCLEIELENASAWYKWGPKQDDKLIAVRGSYQTGILYLNTIVPQNGRFRILATSTPSAARRKSWNTYDHMRMREILTACAAECGMESVLYGLDGDIEYPFLARRMEGGAAFVNRLMELEGAAFKTVQGRFAGIGIAYAQSIPAQQTIAISAEQPGVTYTRRDDIKLGGIILHTPWTECSAQDTSAPDGNREVYTQYPVLDTVQAGRWARGLLLTKNRRAEELRLSSEFNGGFTAMTRIDVDSETDAAGSWLIDEAVHDLLGGKSTIKMLRCIDTIR